MFLGLLLFVLQAVICFRFQTLLESALCRADVFGDPTPHAGAAFFDALVSLGCLAWMQRKQSPADKTLTPLSSPTSSPAAAVATVVRAPKSVLVVAPEWSPGHDVSTAWLSVDVARATDVSLAQVFHDGDQVLIVPLQPLMAGLQGLSWPGQVVDARQGVIRVDRPDTHLPLPRAESVGSVMVFQVPSSGFAIT